MSKSRRLSIAAALVALLLFPGMLAFAQSNSAQQQRLQQLQAQKLQQMQQQQLQNAQRSKQLQQKLADQKKYNDRLVFSNGVARMNRPPTLGEMKRGFTGKVTATGQAIVKVRGKMYSIPASRIGVKWRRPGANQQQLAAIAWHTLALKNSQT